MRQVIFTKDDQGLFSEINMTPLIDATFTILILFIIIAPIIEQGLEISLPSSSYNRTAARQEHVTISITKEGVIYLEKRRIAQADAGRVFEDIARRSQQVLLKADKKLDFQRVVEVLDLLKNAGVTSIAVATEVMTP